MSQKSTGGYPNRSPLEVPTSSLTGSAGSSGLTTPVVAKLGSALGTAIFTGVRQLVHHPPQSRAVIRGRIVAASIGLLCLALLGDGSVARGIEVGLAVALMILTRTFHAPAGATPLVVMTASSSTDFVLASMLAGSALLVVAARSYRNFVSCRAYSRGRW